MPGQEFESKINQRPKILEMMGLGDDAIKAVLKEQGDPLCSKTFAGDLAVSLGYATEEGKRIGLIKQVSKTAESVADDMAVLTRCDTLKNLPAPSYTIRTVAHPSVIDAQQATVNLAANMVKDAGKNPELIDKLAPAVQQMLTLTKEIQQNPTLSPTQLDTLKTACSTYLSAVPLDEQSAKNLNAYLLEVENQVTQGCGTSAKAVEKANETGVNMTPKADPRLAQIDALVQKAGPVHHPAIACLQATIQTLGGSLGPAGIDGAMGADMRTGLTTLLGKPNLPDADKALLATAIRDVDPAILKLPENKQAIAAAEAALGITRNAPAAKGNDRMR